MSIFDLMSGSDDDDMRQARGGDLYQQAQADPQRFFGAAFGQYAKYKTLSELGDEAMERLIPSKKKKLERINAELEVQMKRRALGLPWSDDVYEDATNNDLSFKQKGVVAAFGNHVSKLVPEPGFLTPKGGRGLLETSFPKTTKLADAGSFLLSSGLRAGGKYGSAIGRFFGRG